MSKGEQKPNREKRKPKADAPKGKKVPGYMSGGGMSAGKQPGLSINTIKGKK